MKPALRTITLDHANDVLERADKLDDAVSNLRAFRSLLEDLNARTSIDLPPLDLPPQQVRAIEMVRAGILRSAIALVVAILDSKGRDRAGLGQIVELLNDESLVEFLLKKLREGRNAKPVGEKLQEVSKRYQQLYTAQPFRWVQQLRHDEIGHLLMRKELTPPVQYSDIFALGDEIERLVITLHEGLGISSPRFIALKAQITEQAKVFWQTYFAGVAAVL
jgi:hypothetical protein